MKHYDQVVVDIDADAAPVEEPFTAQAPGYRFEKNSTLSNDINHEIKTRLTAIIGFTEILKTSIAEPKQLHYLDVIRSSGDALLALVNTYFYEPPHHVSTALCRQAPSEEEGKDPEAEFLYERDRNACRQLVVQTSLKEAQQEWNNVLATATFDTLHDVVFAVDDNVDNLTIIAHLFAEQSIKMFPFTNGKDMLEAVQLVTPSLILLDIMMPMMDGYEVCRRLKESDSTAHIPIIFLTSKSSPDDIIEGFQSGGVDYIAKPFRAEELLSRVKTHLKLSQTEQSLKEALHEKGQLLDETLKGSIRVLIDILAMTNPEAFAQTLRVRGIAKKMALRLGLANVWEIEIGVLLSHLGCAVIPTEIVQKKQAGHHLTAQENSIFNSHPKAAARFISSIPRLEQVAESIQHQHSDYQSNDYPDIIRDFIRIVFDYDNRIQSGCTQQQALDDMNRKLGKYNPLVLGALEAEIRRFMDGYVIQTVAFEDLTPGMILADDLRNASNVILVRRNTELSEVLIEKLRNIRYGARPNEPVRILEQM
jgi:response regulator RpfG family c-di-GMP phosphodiesterase